MLFVEAAVAAKCKAKVEMTIDFMNLKIVYREMYDKFSAPSVPFVICVLCEIIYVLLQGNQSSFLALTRVKLIFCLI